MRKDIDFSFRPHPLTGDLAVKTKSNATKQSFKNILMSDFYSRGFNVNFGGGMRQELFENYDHLRQQSIVNRVRQALGNFEPTEVESVLVNFDEAQQELSVDIFYYEVNNATLQSTRIVI